MPRTYEEAQECRRRSNRRRRRGLRRLGAPWAQREMKFRDRDEEIAYIHRELDGPAPIRTTMSNL